MTDRTLCLQGGRELTPDCREMDAAVLGLVTGPVVVLGGAARPGSDYAGVSGRAIDHYGSLGAEVRAAPDPRSDLDGCLAALEDVGLLVLPGGSPASLLAVLTGAVGERVVALQAAGAAISGASAGAMVLCERSAVPDRGRELADGLGMVPGLALPHWSVGGGPDWHADVSPRWGLPECGGVLVEGGSVRSVGRGEPSLLLGDATVPVPREPVPLDRLLAPVGGD